MEYSVYAQVDENNRVIAINSSAFLTDLTGWVKIDCGSGDRYHHAQGNYLQKPILTGGGAYQYKLVDGSVVERSAEDIAADEGKNATSSAITMDELIEYVSDVDYRLMVMELGL